MIMISQITLITWVIKGGAVALVCIALYFVFRTPRIKKQETKIEHHTIGSDPED